MKTKRIVSLALATVVLFGIVLGVSIVNRQNNFDFQIADGEELLDSEQLNGLLPDEHADMKETYVPESDVSGLRDDEEGVEEENEDNGSQVVQAQATEASYNTRDYVTSVRTKYQAGESICWAYSTSTAIEYLLAIKKGVQYEISPKIMDYRMTFPTYSYNESGVSNASYENYYAISNFNRPLGKAANAQLMLAIFDDPLALVSDSKFLSIIKENDSRLAYLNNPPLVHYDDIWKNGYSGIYNVKQTYSKINDPSNTDYIVTGARDIRFPYYGINTDPDNSQIKRADVIQDIKNVIKTYGAVTAGVNVNSACYDYYSSTNNVVFVNDYDSDGNGGNCSVPNHAIVLVGWYEDSSWLAEYGGGVFVVQNSYGDKGDSYVASNLKNYNYYLSYNSILEVRSFYDIENYNLHDHHYSLKDYQAEITAPSSSELVYEFKASKKEKLAALTLSEHFVSRKFDVYISSKYTNNTYQKVNSSSFAVYPGISKYTFETAVMVEGNYKIKLVKTSGDNINSAYRKYNNMIVYTDDVFELSFDVREGSGTPSNQYCLAAGTATTCSVTIGTTVPTRSGYTFGGWTASWDDYYQGIIYNSGDAITLSADKVLYAVWNENRVTRTLTFDKNTSENVSNMPTTNPSCEARVVTAPSCQVTIPSNKPTRSGYTFGGWTASWDDYYQGIIYNPGNTIELSANTTLYAVWNTNSTTFTLSFNANSGSGAPANQTCTATGTATSCSITISSTRPTRAGYTFQGWANSATATTAAYQPGGSITLSANKTIYAVWKLNSTTFTLSFNANSGSGAPANQTCTATGTATSCSITISSTRPTRAGYTFQGWANSATATTAAYQPGGSITLSANKTIYAVWAIIEPDVIVTIKTPNDVSVSVSNRVLTIAADKACMLVGRKGSNYSLVTASSTIEQNNIVTRNYSISGYDEVIVVLKGDGNMDGVISTADSNLANRSLISPALRPYRVLAALEKIILDLDGDGIVTTADSNLINRSLISPTLRPYKKIAW